MIESGKRTPTPAVLELLAQKLDCSLSYLVNGVTAEQLEDIELALGYARLAMENGEISEARTRFAELLANTNLTGLTALRQETEFGLALAAEASGDHEDAIAILNRLKAEEASPERQIEIGVALCRAYRESEQLTEAVAVGEEIIGSVNRPVWSDHLVELGSTLLGAYMLRGDMLRARQFAAELLNAADVLGTPRAIVAANWNAAYVAMNTGHGDEALVFAERAMAVQVENGQPRNIARMRSALGSLQARIMGDGAASSVTQRKALEELEQTSASQVDLGRAQVELARSEALLGDYARAAEHAIAGLGLLPSVAGTLGAEANLLLGHAYAQLGRTEDAGQYVVRVREWLTPMPDTSRAASTWYAAAESFETLGDQGSAVEAYQRALACAGL